MNMVTDDLQHWELVSQITNDDILAMVTDFSAGKISAADLMNRISHRCEVTWQTAKTESNSRAVEKYISENLINLDAAVSDIKQRLYSKLEEDAIKGTSNLTGVKGLLGN